MVLAAAAVATTAWAAVQPAVFTPEETAAADRIRPEGIRAHTRALADDLLEGRGTASRGERLAQLYIVGQMESLGLQPGAPDGTWRQPFDVVGITSHSPDTIRFTRSGKTLDLRFRDDFIAFSGVAEPEARVAAAEVVFVGYGIVAPEYGWDDYKGADVTGKVVLMMNNDPEDDPKLFAGKTRLYYGRWDYKYENAARHGAVAAIIIHTTPSAGYPWQVVQSSWTTEQFSLPRRRARSCAWRPGRPRRPRGGSRPWEARTSTPSAPPRRSASSRPSRWASPSTWRCRTRCAGRRRPTSWAGCREATPPSPVRPSSTRPTTITSA
jgi:hypothetical protein